MSHSPRPSHSRTPSPREDDDTDSSYQHSSPPRSPSHLVLVQDPEDLPELELWQSDDEDDLEGGPSHRRTESIDVGPRIASVGSGPSGPTLNAIQILTLLVSPTLKLGATQLLNQSLLNTPLPMIIFAAVIILVVAAGLNALAVQIYLLLGLYVRRWTIEGVVGEAFVGAGGQRSRVRRERARSPWKKIIVRATKILIVLSSSLLCAAYLRESTDLIVPLVPKSSYTFERVGVAAGLGVLVSPLLAASSIASKRIVYSNVLAVSLYAIVAIVMIVHRYQFDDPNSNLASERDNVLVPRGPIKVHLSGGAWEWINFALFAFAAQFFTYPLFIPYSQSIAAQTERRDQVRRAAPPPSSPVSPTNRKFKKQKKTPPTWNFLALACIASVLAVVLISLPLFLGLNRTSSPNTPSPSPNPGQSPTPVKRTLPRYIEATFNALRVLQAAYLLLGIPPLWVSVISPRLHSTTISLRWVQDIRWHWVLFICLMSLAAFAPPALTHFVSRAAALTVVFFSYVLPALLHITLHTVRSPLAIILPAGPDSTDDLLLRRKERSLQNKRWKRRAAWDLAVWLLLGPIGLISTVWWFGRIVGFW